MLPAPLDQHENRLDSERFGTRNGRLPTEPRTLFSALTFIPLDTVHVAY